MTRFWLMLNACVVLVSMQGCSTSTRFRIPEGTALYVNNKFVEAKENELWSTRAFGLFSSGVNYELYRGNVLIETGKLPLKFRPRSIFWPPLLGILFWGKGFRERFYDLTPPSGTKTSNGTETVADPAKVDQEKKTTESINSETIMKKAKKCQQKGGVWINDRCEVPVE
jgi:hypothetical protein